MSTLLGANQRGGKPVTRLYDPTNAQVLEGSQWKIRYGDKSTAGGKVFLDRVAIGNLAVPNQAVEAATNMSASFTRGGSMDGLLGLGSGKLNTIKPRAQPTWFENVRQTLASPVFTCALKRHASGSFDFGFIDKTKYTGEISWSPVKGQKGFWDFQIQGYGVGGGPVTAFETSAIVDTGSSLWYAPASMVDAYWAKVPDATYNNIQGGYTFPCSTKLPDIQVVIAGKKVSVPGQNMNYQNLGVSTCFGGLQRSTGMPFSIFGDVFLKGLYVIFEHVPGNVQRIGFAQGTFR
jgi:aspergillopepsin I